MLESFELPSCYPITTFMSPDSRAHIFNENIGPTLYIETRRAYTPKNDRKKLFSISLLSHCVLLPLFLSVKLSLSQRPGHP